MVRCQPENFRNAIALLLSTTSRRACLLTDVGAACDMGTQHACERPTLSNDGPSDDS